ncbi:MAG: hypothetical protein ACLPQ6_09395 [Steroidobacteraceae bacterium]
MTRRATWVLSLWLAAAAHAAAQVPPASAPPPSPSADAAAPHAGNPLPQVTVEADRATLQRRLYTFVATLAREIPRDEALRRWQVPVCPLVAGLTREQGEFILQRLSQIAAQVGAPLDKESCVQPNLVVIVSPRPEELLKAWDRHHRMFVGPRDSEAVFQRFRQQSRPVRVWYNHDFGSAKREPILNGSLQIGKASWGIASAGDNSLGSKTFVREVLAFSSVAVIVDGRQIIGLEVRQITDYIAMAALTEVDLDAPLGDAPTILRLFNARSGGQPLPEELSGWDREFLKGLYGMTLDSVTQRSQLRDWMYRDLAP